MHDAVRKLAERGNIPFRDAQLIITWTNWKDIFQALEAAQVWELRDRVLREINLYTSKVPCCPSPLPCAAS
jgi:hypothetical protein